MAEEPKGSKEKEEGTESAKKSKMKLFIIVGVVALLVLGGAGYFFLSKGGGEDTKAEVKKDSGDAHGKKSEKGGHGEEEEEGTAHAGPQILKFEPFIVNLTNTSGRSFLKVTINIEMDSGSIDEANERNAQIRDSIITLLSSKSYSDIGSVSGKYQLRDEIAARINLILSDGRVKSVYFTEFIIQ